MKISCIAVKFVVTRARAVCLQERIVFAALFLRKCQLYLVWKKKMYYATEERIVFATPSSCNGG